MGGSTDLLCLPQGWLVNSQYTKYHEPFNIASGYATSDNPRTSTEIRSHPTQCHSIRSRQHALILFDRKDDQTESYRTASGRTELTRSRGCVEAAALQIRWRVSPQPPGPARASRTGIVRHIFRELYSLVSLCPALAEIIPTRQPMVAIYRRGVQEWPCEG